MIALLTSTSLFSAARQGHCPDHGKKEGNNIADFKELVKVELVLIVLFVNVFKRQGLNDLFFIKCFFGIQRGKTVPEELVRAEDLSKYRQVATHAVSLTFECGLQSYFNRDRHLMDRNLNTDTAKSLTEHGKKILQQHQWGLQSKAVSQILL